MIAVYDEVRKLHGCRTASSADEFSLPFTGSVLASLKILMSSFDWIFSEACLSPELVFSSDAQKLSFEIATRLTVREHPIADGA